MGERGGKTDMERVGLFKELSYITIGDKYVTPGQGVFNESASKGKQMYPGGNTTRSAKQDGYFDPTFSRILEGESYSDPVKRRRQQKLAALKQNLSKAFMPTSGPKTMNGYGTFYGTIGGAVEAFRPTARERAKAKENKNFFTNPGKKGTGYGYANITINPYPPHSEDDYNKGTEIYKKEMGHHKAALKAGVFHLNMHGAPYFNNNPYQNDKPIPPARKWAGELREKTVATAFRPSNPGKLLGGMKAGSFDPYPAHSEDPYGVKVRKPTNVVNKFGRVYMPPAGPKSTPCTSIINQNVLRSVNVKNYRSITVL